MTAACLGLYVSLRYSAECKEGIRSGILFCVEVLVPSLFLLMALSAYLVKSGVLLLLTRRLGFLSRTLFRLPSVSLAAILLCVIGGYPVGARCAAMLYEQGQLSESQAQKTACIAVCAGPGFLMNYVGDALLGLHGAGRLLLAAQTIGMILTGVFISRITRNSTALSPAGTPPPERGDLLLRSVADACDATFYLCGTVVLCAAMIEVIAAISPHQTVTDIAAATVEITTGCQKMCGHYPLPLIAFFIGFGGISVHLQIYAGADKLRIRKGLFFLCRIIQGIITAAATYILLVIFPLAQSVFRSIDAPLTPAKSATLFGSGALVLSSLCFMGSIHHRMRQLAPPKGGAYLKGIRR